MFNLAQTFTVDPSVVRGALEAYVTSIDLYFKQKPKSTNNASGINFPGVEVYIAPTENQVPVTDEISSASHARREYGEIVVSGDASSPTRFTFPEPISIATGRRYAIVVKYDGSEDFVLWTSVQGDHIVGTNKTSPGPSGTGVNDYFEYAGSVGGQWKPLSGIDLKIGINFAKFGANGASVTYSLPIRDYEFITYQTANSSGRFRGGERVFVNSTPISGTLVVSQTSREVVVNSGINFTSSLAGTGDEFVVLTDGDSTDVRRVVSVDSNTRITLDSFPSFSNAAAQFFLSPSGIVFSVDRSLATGSIQNILVLKESNANATVRFTNGDVIVGEVSGASIGGTTVVNIEAQELLPDIVVNTPAGTSARLYHSARYFSVGGNTDSIGTFSPVPNNQVRSADFSPIRFGAPVLIPSRSNEVAYNANSITSSQASVITVNAFSNNEFVVPAIDVGSTDVFVTRYLINDDYTGENGRYGSALAKHVTATVNFAQGRLAEDLVVYVRVHMPAGTDLKVFAKIHNSRDPEPFDDKDWSLLELKDGIGLNSSSIDQNDYIELTYGFPQFPNSALTLSGSATTQLDNVEVIGVGTSYDVDLESDDLVKVYQRLFPNNYAIGVVNTVTNATHFTLNEPIANVGLVGTGLLVDRIDFRHQAFNNQLSENVVRYYNESMVEFDAYDSVAIKTVMLSNTTSVVPVIDDIRFVGVSA